MARKQPHLRRRGNRLHFRQRIPQDLVARFGAKELNIALGTGEIDLAAQRCRLLSVMADRVFDTVRENPDLTRDEIAKLAREYLQVNLEADERKRVEARGTDPYGDTEALSHLLDMETESLRNGHLGDAGRIADRILSGRGYAVEKGSPEYRELCRAILRARIERYKIAIARSNGDYSLMPSDPLFGPSSGPSGGYGDVLQAGADQGPLLSEIFKKWEGERKPNPRTRQEWETAFRMFYEIVADKPIRGVTRDDIRVFKDTLLKVPASMSKKFRGLSVSEAIERAKGDPEVKTLSPASVNKYLTAIGSVLSYAVNNGYAENNVAHNLKVAARPNRNDRRLPYSDADLKKIFSWPIYTGCASKLYRMKPGPLVIRDSLYWLPLLALYTGCRAEELCQAATSDVKQIRGIWVLDVNEEGEKSVKAQSSRRLVPLHPQLIKAGFVEYAEGLKRKGEKRLFPDLTRSAHGKWAANFSKRWGRYQRAMGITDPRKVFHSFRHRFRDALRDAQVDTGVANALMGHADQSMGGRYGKGFSVEVLAEAIGKINYPVNLKGSPTETSSMLMTP